MKGKNGMSIKFQAQIFTMTLWTEDDQGNRMAFQNKGSLPFTNPVELVNSILELIEGEVSKEQYEAIENEWRESIEKAIGKR